MLSDTAVFGRKSFAHTRTLVALGVVVLNICLMINTNSGAFCLQELLVPKQYISLFPWQSSGHVGFHFYIIPRLDPLQFRRLC